ncbi:MAG: ribosome-binding factor A [Rhodospirillaceae bacterium]|nr:ribosome-binding factor A [Rhodospirillaceae bacterium]|tara:strand:- start:10819 stop:11223 length:405 start_codon:yes stop_codon:yes gene_type:complete
MVSKKKSKKAGMTKRQLRVGELIRGALVDVLSKNSLYDPIFEEVSITVCEVRPTPDLRVARVFVLPLGGGQEEDVIEALTRASLYLRSEVTKLIRLKFSPELRFELDHTFEYAKRIDNLLEDVLISERKTDQQT